MTFQQLKYVVEIAECGSINRAAARLFVSQSSVSCALSQLEEELCTVLFNRSNFGVTLTEAGKRFVSYAASLLERKAEMENFFLEEHRKKEISRSFFISAQHYQCSAAAFVQITKQAKYAMYRFSYHETSMDSVIVDVANSQADIGIIIVSSATEGIANHYLSRRNLSFNTIAEVQPCVFCSKSHPLAKREALTLADISVYPYVTFAHPWGMPIDFSQGANKLSLHNHQKCITTNNRSTMTEFLCNTDAVSTGSGLLVEGFTDPRLVSIPLIDSTEVMRFGWIGLNGMELSQIAKDYLNVLEKITNHSLKYTGTVWNKSWLYPD